MKFIKESHLCTLSSNIGGVGPDKANFGAEDGATSRRLYARGDSAGRGTKGRRRNNEEKRRKGGEKKESHRERREVICTHPSFLQEGALVVPE